MLKWLFAKPPVVPEWFTVEEADWHLDGGSIMLAGPDKTGRRRAIVLSQHMFPNRRGVGWLYLYGHRVARRGDMERSIIRLLHAILAELMKQPADAVPGERTPADALAETGGTVIISDDIAEMFGLTKAGRVVRLVSEVINYVESGQYGKVTG